jgi:hypothetical protein
VETITTLFAENLELKNRLAAVESTHGGFFKPPSPPPPSPPPMPSPPPSVPIPDDGSWHIFVAECLSVWPKLRSPASARRGHLRILTERYRTGIRVW